VEGSQSYGPFDPNALTVVLTSGILARTEGFNFLVATENAPGGTVDRAPDQGAWSFDLKRQPVRLSVARFSTKPKTPRAGRVFAAMMTVTAPTSVDLFAALDRSPACRANIGARRLPDRPGRVDGGTNTSGREFVRTTCAWPIPPRTAGRLLKGSMTLTFNGIPVTRRFSARIAR
jgi:hypothetical protein